jgi:hypothetical protein
MEQTTVIRRFLVLEVIGFALASLVHFGVLVSGYEHPKARVAESIIAAVLLVGLMLTIASPTRTRTISLAVQGFALLGTFVGVFTILIGVGPQSLPDIIFHVSIIGLLLWGIITARRIR